MWDKWEWHPTLPGVVQKFHEGFDSETTFVRQKVQDIAPIIDANTETRNNGNGRTSGGGRKIGSIPATLYYDWVAEWERKGLIGPGNMEPLNGLLIARLRDRDYSKFRSTDGGI